jgi:DNA-binding NtrC family response regulator
MSDNQDYVNHTHLHRQTIPIPRRDRPVDIPYLANRFLAEASVELRRPVQQIVPSALALLVACPWSGNVRELHNIVRQAVLKSRDLMIGEDVVRDLLKAPGATRQAAGPGSPGLSLRDVAAEATDAAERVAITLALRAARGNKSQAARALRTDYKTLHLKIKRFGMRAQDFIP